MNIWLLQMFMTFPKLLWFTFFFMTFPGLEMTILKFHDFSRFSMTVRTLMSQQAPTNLPKTPRPNPSVCVCVRVCVSRWGQSSYQNANGSAHQQWAPHPRRAWAARPSGRRRSAWWRPSRRDTPCPFSVWLSVGRGQQGSQMRNDITFTFSWHFHPKQSAFNHEYKLRTTK